MVFTLTYATGRPKASGLGSFWCPFSTSCSQCPILGHLDHPGGLLHCSRLAALLGAEFAAIFAIFTSQA